MWMSGKNLTEGDEVVQGARKTPREDDSERAQGAQADDDGRSAKPRLAGMQEHPHDGACFLMY